MAPTERDERYERGMNSLLALDAEKALGVINGLKDFAPDMSRFLLEFAYGDVYSRPGLDPKSRQVATVAALTALGHAAPQLKFHIGASLNIGITPEEIIEVMYVVAVFSGFPNALNGITAAREVFTDKGVSLPERRDPYEDEARHARGLEAVNHTSKGSGERVIKNLRDVAPDMAGFIIDFAYGDVIARNILTPAHKEIAMIAVCAARGGMEPQMKVHIHAALHVGVTKNELIELMTHMVVYAGFPAGLNALSAARSVFEESEGAKTGG